MGGTFDPIHVAHLIIAEEALESAGLERVIFVPAARPPHKTVGEITAVGHRLEMVRLAIADNPRLEISDVEAGRPEPSYTIDTVRHFRRELGEEEALHFIMGADSLAQFFTWKSPVELLSSCEFIVVPRPGVRIEDGDARIREKARVLDTPLMGVSSSDIRERARTGRSIRYLVPPAVRAYIEKKSLYS
ncbi:MAG: nicotinate-nucleotide adenylyltransferase [Candidatus Eisenbacteria bacterium]|nr:nicotinate-nucleotide adenylyltransferase [Candidatus Eisenbacteria bacterium]